ncbi:hypothetical protein JRQ81_019968 [Phrynocephalus forsythii]|uniref:Uncharacterized protein n=1 Tax=Phrynocephalus forsythii TaxID=171643 RepID=A0A9Q0XP01_9SAUR|nr:hypothetical protein JRQ81_019968 [Phrynocephalus forsythii]
MEHTEGFQDNTITPQGPFLVPVTLGLPNGRKVPVYAMVDSGAVHCFVDAGFVRCHRIPVQNKETPLLVEFIDLTDFIFFFSFY